MQELLEASLIWIHTADGHVVGAGFLVGERHLLTCAHVVDTCLNWPALLSIHHQESSRSTSPAYAPYCQGGPLDFAGE
jgi:hypothetical protein